jgi:hypothetical protein
MSGERGIFDKKGKWLFSQPAFGASKKKSRSSINQKEVNGH